MNHILRKPAVKAAMGHRSDTSVQNAVRDGLCTKPVAIGARAIGWPSREIEVLVNARIAGKTNDEIRALVNRLHEQRAAIALALA